MTRKPNNAPLSGESAKPIRILVVDDSEVARRAVVSYLRTLPGVEVVDAVTSGTEALTLLRNVAVDLALVDLQMPAPNGVDTTVSIRRRFPRVRVVLISATSSTILRLASMEAGADDCIAKHQLAAALPGTLNRLFAGPQEEKKQSTV